METYSSTSVGCSTCNINQPHDETNGGINYVKTKESARENANLPPSPGAGKQHNQLPNTHVDERMNEQREHKNRNKTRQADPPTENGSSQSQALQKCDVPKTEKPSKPNMKNGGGHVAERGKSSNNNYYISINKYVLIAASSSGMKLESHSPHGLLSPFFTSDDSNVKAAVATELYQF